MGCDSALDHAIMADAKPIIRTVASDKILENLGDILTDTSLLHANAVAENGPTHELIADCEHEYNLSRPAPDIPFFISHSWRTGRLQKANAIAIFLHARVAVLITLLTLATLSAIVGYRFSLSDTLCQPKTTMAWLYDCFWAGAVPVITGLVFAFVVQFGYHLPGMKAYFFLDKVCIHQGDTASKQRVIESLDILLLYSRRMLVLWAPDYFDRLWCIYELATFMKLHPDGAARVDFIPTWMPTFISLMNLMLAFTMPILALTSTGPILGWGMDVAGPYWGYVLVHDLACILPMALGASICYLKVSQHTLMMRQMSNFRLGEAMCQEPSDKAFILGLIELMWSSSPDSQDGQQNFERHVREKLPVQLEKAMGARAIFPYHVTLIAFLPLLGVHSMFSLMCDQHMVRSWGFTSAFPDPNSRYAAFCFGWAMYAVLNFCCCNPSTTVFSQLACAYAVDSKWKPSVCAAVAVCTYVVSLCTLIDLIVAFVMWDPANWFTRPVAFGLAMGVMTFTCWNLPKRMVR